MNLPDITSTSIRLLSAVGLLAVAAPSTVSAMEPSQGSEMTLLTEFGSGLGSGSTIGPDGALYVTDGNAGTVLRIDRSSGTVATFAEGLPLQRLGIGGAMDVAFIDDTANVFVTAVGGEIIGGEPIGDDVVGIYRLEPDGSFAVVADLGAWSVAHPPTTDFFITTGVQYALETLDGGLLVSDGHHNRVLSVTPNGEVSVLRSFDNVVPTGLDTSGDQVYMAEAGPLPHRPEDGRVIAFDSQSSTADEVARGASMIVDVEIASNGHVYALSQGDWDEASEGSPALADTGRLIQVGPDGDVEPVVDGAGAAIVLDRPTSMEFVDRTAYVVSLTGAVYTISDIES